ncbi:MAG: DUF4159 domain-containing protein [Planctomycetes bacterium]|nr:DUF4159 domain-containing protein [Planctomycetota bacterium]
MILSPRCGGSAAASAQRPRRGGRRLGVAGGAAALLVATGLVLAQFRGERRIERGSAWDERRGVPDWEIDPDFRSDVFTFVRIAYGSWGGYDRGWGRRGRGGGGWRTDYPDSDLNFSFRLQQLTSLKVDPRGEVLELTDDRLFDYPFIYIVEPGRGMFFEEEDAAALRRYLLAGGFLMVDDFWGDYQWDLFYAEIKKVFPEREPVDVDLGHEIFHIVYDLKEKPQIPSIDHAQMGRSAGITYETGHGPNAETPHYRAIYDDKGRMMVFICHNTDLGDGWEREGEDEWYFREFSEKKAYPLGINIVVYAMTH